VAQLARRGERAGLIGSMAAAAAAGVVCALGAAWVTLTFTPLGDAGVVIAGLAIAGCGAVLVAGPWWAGRGWSVDALLGLAILGGVIGAVVALLFLDPGTVSLPTAAALGLVAGGTSVVARSWVVAAANEAAAKEPVAAGLAASQRDAEAAAADVPADELLPSAPDDDLRPSPGPADLLVAAGDQALIAATCAAVLVAAVPVYVAARILVG
jgi:hypothetical protein